MIKTYQGEPIAIIGASYLQAPLIKAAKAKGLTTHVFAWRCNDVGEQLADCFHPISIVENEQILEACKLERVCGICSIASDLAERTVSFVASKMGLIGNSWDTINLTTNKHAMRDAFSKMGDPSPKSIAVGPEDDPCYAVNSNSLAYPLIVKPTDRSGSRGVEKVESEEVLRDAVLRALDESFESKAVIEEYIPGNEYSVECLVHKGLYKVLAITEKRTTGAPHFIETGHIQPALLSEQIVEKVTSIVCHALKSLQIQEGAAHAEVKISGEDVTIVEIGARMGGDYIGSHLVPISTGIDYVGAVIDIAMGHDPDLEPKSSPEFAAVSFFFDETQDEMMERIQRDPEVDLVDYAVMKSLNSREMISDSSTRNGCVVIKSNNRRALERYI